MSPPTPPGDNHSSFAGLAHRNAELSEKIAVLTERIERTEQAKALQAKEYERRLEDLNHAHAQAQEVLATYVPRELYHNAHVELDKRVKEMEDWRIGLEGGAKTAVTIGRVVWAVIGGVGGVVALYFWQFFTGQLP